MFFSTLLPLCLLINLVCPWPAQAAGFVVSINFQRTNSANVAGYLPDAGYVFGDRGNGYAYGWNVDNTVNAFERNQWSDKKVDTGNKLQPGGQSLSWEVAVPNGLYDVLLVAADPADQGGKGTRYNINVEGVRDIIDGVPSANQWIFGTNTHLQVWVADRRLTVTNGPNATNNSLCYIEIKQVAPIFWGPLLIDNTGTNKSPWDYQYPTAGNPGVLGSYESHTGKRVSLLGWGDSWSNMFISSYDLFKWNTNVYGMSGMWARGTIPYYTWGPTSDGALGDTNFSLQNINAGKHDAYLSNWAAQAKAYGKPFFLRFAWEMNGTWYPWSEGIGVSANAPPGSYTNMWRRVHDIFTRVGCTNATWLWCVDEDTTNSWHLPGGIKQFYPGDTYVDWLGMDAYNTSTSPPGESFTTIFGATYTNLMNLAPGKPIMICETATEDGGAPPGNSKPAWIADALAQLPVAFANVRAFSWYNVNNTDTNCDYPIEGGGNSLPYWSAPVDWASVGAWSNGIASPYYLANVFTNQANITASPIQPIVILNPPASLAASVSNATVRLIWPAVAGATNYNVYRSISSSEGTFAWLAGTTGTNGTDTTSTFGATYYYVVAAQNLAGESADSVQASATTPILALSVQLTRTNTVLFLWPSSLVGFVLQSNSDLRTANWQNVTATVNVVNGQNQIIVSPPNGSQFYRLKLS